MLNKVYQDVTKDHKVKSQMDNSYKLFHFDAKNIKETLKTPLWKHKRNIISSILLTKSLRNPNEGKTEGNVDNIRTMWELIKVLLTNLEVIRIIVIFLSFFSSFFAGN